MTEFVVDCSSVLRVPKTHFFAQEWIARAFLVANIHFLCGRVHCCYLFVVVFSFGMQYACVLADDFTKETPAANLGPNAVLVIRLSGCW